MKMLNDMEYAAWQAKLHKEWYELTGDKLDRNYFVDPFILDELKKAEETAKRIVAAQSMGKPARRKNSKLWVDNAFMRRDDRTNFSSPKYSWLLKHFSDEEYDEELINTNYFDIHEE